MSETTSLTTIHEAIPEAEYEIISPITVSSLGTVQLIQKEKLVAVLDRFDETRQTFNQWLLRHFVKGIHYGFPPGCEAHYDKEGNLVIKSYNRFKKEWTEKPYPPSQWKPSPMLYNKGVMLAVELVRYRPTYEVARDMWEMMGAIPGHLIMRCSMYSGNILVGEGTGSAYADPKSPSDRDGNKIVKLANIRASRAALFNAFPVMAGLFSGEGHDPDENQKHKVENEAKPDVRASSQQKTALAGEIRAWLKSFPESLDVNAFCGVVNHHLFGKSRIDTVDELGELKNNYKNYLPETGERVPDSDSFNLEEQ